MEALVADGLLRHSDIDVKVSVASCISEIMRITAPDQPYDDSRIKDFFELAVLTFGKLSCLDGRCYSKAVSIIEVLAKYRTCMLMLDLMLDSLIVQMFQHFLNGIRPDHPDKVFMDIEEIMTMIIKESENIPMQFLSILVSILINSVTKENQVENAPEELAPPVAPERVVPFLDQPPNLLGKDDPKHKDGDVVLVKDTTLKALERGDAMKQRISTNSRTTSRPENLGFINTVEKALYPEATQTSKKRGWKPSFLNKPEEGYDDARISGERRSKAHILSKGCGKDTKKRSSSSPKCAISNDEDKNPIMTSIKRRQKEKNEKIGQNDGAKFSSISARDSQEARTKKKISQPTSFASEEFAVVEALGEKEKDNKKTISSRYRDKRQRSSVGESRAEALGSGSNTKEINFPKAYKKQRKQRKRKNLPSQEEALGSFSISKKSNLPKTSK